MAHKTLVIMAGGLGSRFGGLKQVEPVDKYGDFIIDYSVFDAIKMGFDKVVFIIKKENYDIFKSTIGARVKRFVKVQYAFQGMTDYIPKNLQNIKREKPWGTGHAVLCAKDKIDGDFAVINADDFYGRDGFRVASNFFDDIKDESIYALVGYEAGNTITDNGSVKRGVCDIDNGYLKRVRESSIEKRGNELFATELGTDKTTKISFDTLVSMNLVCFRKNYLDILEKCFNDFLSSTKVDLTKDEFLLLAPLEYAVKNGHKMQCLETNAIWYGFTYKEDKEKVVGAIGKMIDSGIYPSPLWN